MKKTSIESYEYRCKMAEMHDDFKERLEKANKNKQYVEVTWICYAIFEQRIHRLINKHIKKCPRPKKKNNNPVSISTKICCIRKLTKVGYGAYSNFDMDLLDEISKWCKSRNLLVHSLLDVSTYRNYDKDFKALASEGVMLVNRLYTEATKVRDWYYDNSFGKFPDIKCKCTQRCIIEEISHV